MTKVVHIESIDQWNNIVKAHNKNGGLLVCKCGSSWCPPCKALAPKLDTLSLSYDPDQVLFISVDIDEHGEIAEKFNVTSLPTTLVLKNCKVVKTIVGADLAGIKSAIDNNI